MINLKMGMCAAVVMILGTAFAGEVEYVESTGSQYFNTGIVPKSTTRSLGRMAAKSANSTLSVPKGAAVSCV